MPHHLLKHNGPIYLKPERFFQTTDVFLTQVIDSEEYTMGADRFYLYHYNVIQTQ